MSLQNIFFVNLNKYWLPSHLDTLVTAKVKYRNVRKNELSYSPYLLLIISKLFRSASLSWWRSKFKRSLQRNLNIDYLKNATSAHFFPDLKQMTSKEETVFFLDFDSPIWNILPSHFFMSNPHTYFGSLWTTPLWIWMKSQPGAQAIFPTDSFLGCTPGQDPLPDVFTLGE